jgi:type IX secretion system PorP/SprF family membrane protein
MFILSIRVYGQDPVFSQFYLNKTYLNPAYAGYTQDFSIGFQSRHQWTHIPGVFLTNTAAVNFGSPSTRLGYGFQFYDNTEGEGRLNTRSGCVQLSYNLPGRFGRKFGNKMYGKKYIVSFGMQGSIGQKSIDWSKFTFTDQLDPYEGLVLQNTALVQGQESSNIIYDLSAGIRARSEFGRRGSFVSLGAAMFHLNSPKESFFGFHTTLDPRYTGHFFIHFQTRKYMNNPSFLSIGYVFDRQQVLQTNTVYVAKDLTKNFTVGAAFRRKLVFNVDQNNDSFILQFTFQTNSLILGYSYDLTVSSLSVTSTFGSHEIGLIYTFRDSRLKKRQKPRNDKEECFFLNAKMKTEMKP